MGKSLLLWCVAALAGGIIAVAAGAWLGLPGIPPSIAATFQSSGNPLDSPAAQARLAARQPAPPPHVKVLKVGDDVPASFMLPNLDGRPQTLAQYRGQPVLINFWATWCHPCLKEMPTLAKTQRAHPGLRILGVAMDQKTKVETFLKHTPVPYPIWLGLTGEADPTAVFGDTAGLLPYSVLIDANGQIVATHLGALDDTVLAQWLQETAAPAGT